MSAELITTAQNVARNTGWAVFPCGENKIPAIGKSEGGRGFLDASIDPSEIARLFSHKRATFIGVATGDVSGIDVLDVDIKHEAAKAWLITAQTRIPPTRTYQTRNGGFHLLFRHAEGVHNTESHVARGIDTRGTGGYIVLWFAAGFPCVDHSPAVEWPDWLLEAIFFKPEPELNRSQSRAPYVSDGSSAQRMVDAALRKLRNACEGQRHATLRAAACTIGGVMVAAKLSRERAVDLLVDAVVSAGGPRVDQRNAKSTAEWGIDKGATSPLLERN